MVVERRLGTDRFRDDRFVLFDEVDQTKQACFQLSGIASGQKRVITLADFDVNLSNLVPYIGATGNVDLGTHNLDAGAITGTNLHIKGAIPILTFKDNTDTGDSARGFQEWRDSDNVRLGFFGNSSYTHDDLVWKNESSGGHLLLETTGIGIVSSNTDFTTTGAITGSYVNITDESNGYQVDGIRVLSMDKGGAVENIYLGNAGNFTSTAASNFFAGDLAGALITDGSGNIGIGSRSLYSNTSGYGNIALSAESLTGNTAGHHNIGIGHYALKLNTTGIHNIAIGGLDALWNNQDGNYNVVIGYQSGFTNTSGSSSVFLGNQAGYYETASNKLFIDNQQRAGEADGRKKALIYGVFDAAIANQSLVFNTGSIATLGTLGAGAITGTSFIISGNTLDASEWANLDGLDQAVATTSTPSFTGASFTDDISIAAGKKFSLANGDIVMQRASAGSTVFRVATGSGSSGNQGSGLYLTNDGANPANSASSDFGMLSLIAQVQLVQFVADTAGNQIVITNIANRGKDHDHALQTDPTLYVHSDTDPDTANTQWISLTHDKTDGVIAAGLGDVKIDDDLNVTGIYKVDGIQVVTNQQAHIADAPGDTTANNATAINAILVALETHGLLADA